jgi:hypothetical protein
VEGSSKPSPVQVAALVWEDGSRKRGGDAVCELGIEGGMW